MNKKDFEAYINNRLEGLSLSRQLKELRKIQNDYIPDLIHKRQKKEGTWVEPEKAEQYILCKKCKRYSLKKEYKKETVNEIRTEATYIDCGYGDDDMYGDVEYSVTYGICPKCDHKQELRKMRIRIIREWNRKGGRK